MNPLKTFLTSTLLATTLLFVGCGGGGADPLEPIALNEIPATTTNLFSSASEQMRTLAYQGVNALQHQDPTRAWNLFSSLAANPELNKEQRAFVARAVASLSEEMQRTAAAGDARANQALRTYGASK